MSERELLAYHINNAANYIKRKISNNIDTAIILGSGLGILAEELEQKMVISYGEIPNFPVSTTLGHKGQLVYGTICGKEVICMQGRFHFYEGYDLQTVTLPVRVLRLMGIENLIITNSAGGINTSFEPGDLMIINDHINLMGMNPLMGENLENFGVRFPDMTSVYDKEFIEIANEVAKDLLIDLKSGVYAALAGPSYETPAEIRFLRSIGADCVGMSTVPEAIIAKHSGIRILGLSCITNMGAGILPKALNHNEVLDTAMRVKSKFIMMLRDIVKRI